MRFFCLLLLASACREPFGTDRHDLVGLRVAAISAAAHDSDEIALTTLTIVDGRPWSDQAITFAWHRAEGLDEEQIAALPLDGALASGPAPILPAGTSGPIALVATDGQTRWNGRIELPTTPGSPPPMTGIELRSIPLSLDSLTGEDLPLNSRRRLSAGDLIPHVPAGDFARLNALTDEGVTVRWMNTAPGGTFLELDDRTTDWAAGTFVADDDDIESRQIAAPGARTIVGLALDPAGGGANRWFTREVWVDESPPGITVAGRWIGTDATVDSPWVQGTLTADDGAPTGLRLTDVTPATADTDPGTDALNCSIPVSGFFDANWLFEQRCTRAAVVGATIVVNAQ